MLTTSSAPERRRNYSEKPRWSRRHSGFPGISRALCLELAAEELTVNIHHHYSMSKVKRVTTSGAAARHRIGNEYGTSLLGLLKLCRDWQDTGCCMEAAVMNKGDKGSRNHHVPCGQCAGMSPVTVLWVMLLNAESLKSWLKQT